VQRKYVVSESGKVPNASDVQADWKKPGPVDELVEKKPTVLPEPNSANIVQLKSTLGFRSKTTTPAARICPPSWTRGQISWSSEVVDEFVEVPCQKSLVPPETRSHIVPAYFFISAAKELPGTSTKPATSRAQKLS
jgi:hypothetical protein